MIAVLAVVVTGYLLGAIPFGLLIARAYGVSDVRTHGSGNIGATNVMRVAGAKAAIWVYILDIGKGALAVAIARMVHQSIMPRELLLVMVGLAAVLGHVFPIYLGFRGGKGVNTGLGIVLSLIPIESLICLGLFILVLAISKYVSLSSIIAATALSGISLAERCWLRPQFPLTYLILALCLTCLIILTHRANIKRLINGTESRFSLKSRKSEPQAGLHV